MATVGKIEYMQLIRQLQEIDKELKANGLNTNIICHIDDVWYTQKIEELALLREQFEETVKRAYELRAHMDLQYRQVRGKYKRDSGWLKNYKKQSAYSKIIQ